MRTMVLGLTMSVVMLISAAGQAQVSTPSRPPVVTETSDWQLRGEPVFYAGDIYERTGPDVFFDANVMVRTGVYRGVPLYVDTTLQPFSVVYVPVGRNLMRPYEKRRIGELAGTTGSRTPSFPGRPERSSVVEPLPVPNAEIVGTGGVAVPRAESPESGASAPRPAPATIVESIPTPRSNAGVWIEFNGTRWYAAGRAESYARERFTQVGTYRGFPVYREKSGASRSIYVPAVTDGPVTPYRQGP
jgi:hypothetical protein